MTKEKSSQTFGILWIALALLLTWSALALAGGGDDTDLNAGGKGQALNASKELQFFAPEINAGPAKLPIVGPKPVQGPDDFGPPNQLPLPGGSDDRQ